MHCWFIFPLVALVTLSEARYHEPTELFSNKNLKLKDLLSRPRRQTSRYSEKYNQYMIKSAKVLLNDVGTDFCKGDPFLGIQCFEENICVAWEEICDGYQSCALDQLRSCLNQTLHDYGYEDKSKCAGEEKQDWCSLRLYTPTRCGRDIKLKALDKAIITSPNYPARYEDDMNCFWSVEVPEGRKIAVQIRNFRTEPEIDYVSIGNGIREDPKKETDYFIYRHTGLELPAQNNFTTSGNTMYITFSSDDWDREEGFAIDVFDSELFETPPPKAKSPFPFKSNKDCNIKIDLDVGEEKIITSPNYPKYYNNSQTCTWSIKIKPGRRVGINFKTFDVEDKLDRVEVGSGGQPDTPERAYTGRDVPEPFVSSTNKMWVRLITNPALRRSGFEAVVRDQPYNECGGDIEIPSGGSSSIASPFYPDRSYTLDAFCLWTITSPPGTELSFFFRDFLTEPLFDSLSLGSGKENAVDGSNYAITLHTGSKLPEPANITIEDNLAWLVFSSDYSMAYKGFFVDVYDATVKRSKNTFKPKEGPSKNIDCGDIISVKETLFELSSPGSPSYLSMLDCTWLLSFPIAAEVNVRFMRFESELMNDLFEMGNGNDPDDSSSSFLKHSGTERPDDFLSNSTDLWIRFKSNFIVEMKGWSIEFDSLPDTKCGGEFFVPEGGRTAIASPGYPSMYQRNTKCTYIVNAPPGKRMRVTVQTFQTEGRLDTLTIGNGCDPAINGTLLLDEHFGFFLPIPDSFVSESGGVWMSFETGVYGSDYQGFAVSFEDTDLTISTSKDADGNPTYACSSLTPSPPDKPDTPKSDKPKPEETPKSESEPETKPEEGSGLLPGM